MTGLRNRRNLDQQQQQHPQPNSPQVMKHQQQHTAPPIEQLKQQRSFEKPVNKRIEQEQFYPHETQSERG